MHSNLNRRRFMKKKFLFIPLLATLLCGCSLEDISNFFKFNKADESSTIDTSGDNTPSEDQNPPHEDPPSENVPVTSITLAKDSTTIEQKQSETLSYTVLPTNATNKNVTWSTSNASVASVNNGTVLGVNPGTATITVTTKDGNKTDTCEVTVIAKVATYTVNFKFNDKGYSGTQKDLTEEPVDIDETIQAAFSIGSNTKNNPVCIKYNSVWSSRLYPGNTLSLTSSDPLIRKVQFVFDTSKDSPDNPINVSSGMFSVDTWTGSTREIVFTAGGTNGGNRCISQINVTYEGEGPAPEVLIDLGEKSISEVKQYIAEHPVKKNSFGNGVNEYRKVTVKGFALAKIDLVKTKSAYGLDVSEPGKVVMADATDYIAVASKRTGDGTSLWGKIDDHVCESTSKYIVTGYISEYLGHPEIYVESFTWDSTLDITFNASIISDTTANLDDFYSRAVSVNYNCAGHGYGEVLTIKNLKCYFRETDGSGKRYYNLTDGTLNLRVNAFNLSDCTEGGIYDITGIISLKNLSPIIVAFEIKSTQNPDAVNLDYVSVAQDISITNLKKIKGDQEDTKERFPDVVNAYGTIFKTTGYLTAVDEGGKLYIGISDSYIDRDHLISGKTNAMANYGISLIKNDNFWNTTEEELYLFNPTYDDYLLENNPIIIYYVVKQLDYSDGKPMWEILLLPSFIDSLQPTE